MFTCSLLSASCGCQSPSSSLLILLICQRQKLRLVELWLHARRHLQYRRIFSPVIPSVISLTISSRAAAFAFHFIPISVLASYSQHTNAFCNLLNPSPSLKPRPRLLRLSRRRDIHWIDGPSAISLVEKPARSTADTSTFASVTTCGRKGSFGRLPVEAGCKWWVARLVAIRGVRSRWGARGVAVRSGWDILSVVLCCAEAGEVVACVVGVGVSVGIVASVEASGLEQPEPWHASSHCAVRKALPQCQTRI